VGEGWILEGLKLLFGQVGVLGTVIIGFAGFIAWLYIKEREAHDSTRQLMLTQNEARYKVLESNLATLKELQHTVGLLVDRSSRNGRQA
jgi:hypothetical protein